MTKWEYKIVHQSQLTTEADFNIQGGIGWELIFFVSEQGNYYFKRLLE